METKASLTPEQRAGLAHLSAQGMAESDVLSSQATGEIVKALEGADLPTYNAVRTVWVADYQRERAERAAPVTEESAGKAWTRLIKASGLEKPKSESPEATAIATKREADRKEKAAALAALTPEQINEEKAALREKAADGNKNAAARIATLNAETERREKALADAESDAVKALRKDCAERIKTATPQVLEMVLAVLKGEVEVSDAPHDSDAPTLAGALDDALRAANG